MMSKKTEGNNQKNERNPDWQGAKESLQRLAQKPKESLEKFLRDNYQLIFHLKAQGYSDQDICALLKEKSIPGAYLRNFREVFSKVQKDVANPPQTEGNANGLSLEKNDNLDEDKDTEELLPLFQK